MNYMKYLRTIVLIQTQREIADAVGVTERQYRRIENNESLPSYKTILALEAYFHKPIWELLGE